MRRDRGCAQGERASAAVGNSLCAIDGYDAYFGLYELGLDGTVREELVRALSAGDVGKVVTRQCRVHDGELVIELETTNDGEV